MKVLNRILPILFLVLATSCSGLLEESPETFYSEATIFSTEEGVETAINGLYDAFGSVDYYGTAWHAMVLPVSGKFFSSQIANRDATGLNTTPSNTWVGRVWAQAYKTINRANIVIQNLENTTLELENRERALGDAYLLRAVAYFDLVRLFGGVPLRILPTELEDIHLSRSTKATIYDQVIADFELAKRNLPEAGDQILGRPSRLAANVYLAKVYMTLAGEDGGDPSFWSKAYEEAIVVFNSQAYQLTPTFAELFVLENENTVESIFEIQYGHTGGVRNADLVRFYTPSKSTFAPSNAPTFGRIRPNKETYDDHLNQYPDDPRIGATFIAGQYDKATGGVQKIYPEKNNGNQGFAVISKWFDSSYNGTTTARNYILLRYADVLLMLAEIENELNGPDNAYQYVNQVLARARDIDGDGVGDAVEPADWDAMSKDEFRTRIMRERRYELLSEGQEWFDTRRRGYNYFIAEVVEPHNAHPAFDPTTDFIYPSVEKNMLLPIPLTEISGNQMVSVEDQNPGY